MYQLTEEEKEELRHVDASELLKFVLYGKWSRSRQLRSSLPETVTTSMPSLVHLAPSTVERDNFGAFSTVWMQEGLEIGPFTGCVRSADLYNTSSFNPWMWEILDVDGQVKHFIDASDINCRTWISYVNCARNETEQNLEVVQRGREIYYRTTKNISPDQELLVWYGTMHRLFFGMLDPGWSPESQISIGKVQQESTCPTAGSKMRCTVCRRGFNSKSNLRSHMRIHTMEKPFICMYCQRSFSQSSTLRNHTRLHTGERPYKCLVCQSAYSQLAGLRAHQKSSKHKPKMTQQKHNFTAGSSSNIP